MPVMHTTHPLALYSLSCPASYFLGPSAGRSPGLAAVDLAPHLGSMQPPWVTPSCASPYLAPLPEATQSCTHASVAAVVRVP